MLQGDTSNLPLTNLIQTLALNQQEGILTVTCNKAVRCLAVKQNNLALLTERPYDSAILSQVLDRLGLLKPSEYQNVFATANGTHPPGDVLVQRHLITEEQTRGPIRELIVEKTLETFLWSAARYKFELRDLPVDRVIFSSQCSGELFDVPINSLLMEVARREDEWERIKHSIRDNSQIYKVTASRDDYDKLLAANDVSAPRREELLRLLNGELTLAEILETVSMPEFFVYSSLRSLLEAGFAGPVSLEEKRRLAQSARSSFQLQRVPQIYRSILAEDPQDSETRKQLVVLLERNRTPASDIIDHYRLLAESARTDGQRDDEERYLAKVHDLDPRDLQCIAGLARLARARRKDREWARHLSLLVTTTHSTKLFSEGCRLLVELAQEDEKNDGFLQSEVAAMFATAGDVAQAGDWFCRSAECFHQRKDVVNLAKVIDHLDKCDPSLTSHWRRRLADLERSRSERGKLGKFIKAIAIPMLLVAGIAALVGYEWQARTAYAQAMEVARTKFKEGEEDEALAHLENFRKRYPLSLVARSLAESKRELESFRSSSTEPESVAQESTAENRPQVSVSSDLEALLTRAASLVTRGKYDEALEIYASLDPKQLSPRIRSFVTGERMRIGEYLGAAKKLARRAKSAADEGRLAESRELYMRVIVEYPLSREAQVAKIPVVIDTLPPDAKVTQKGVRLAGPPYVARIPVGFTEKIEVVAPGFTRRVVDVDPMAEWYIHVPLQRQTSLRIPCEGSIEAQPLLHRGLLFLAPRSGSIQAIDAVTSDLRWSYPLDRVGSALGALRPYEDSVVFSCTNGSIYRLRATGDLVSRIDLPQALGIVRTPLSIPTSSGEVYFTSDRGHAGKIDLDEGVLRWTVPLGAPAVSEPVLAGRTILTTTSRGDVVCMSTVDGREIWRRQVGAHPTSRIQVDGVGRLFIGTSANGLLCLSTNDGAEIWKVPAAGSVVGGASIAGDVLTFATNGGQLVGVDPNDGGFRYTVDLATPLEHGPVGTDEQVFVVDPQGVIRAHGRDNGLLLWQHAGGHPAGAPLHLQNGFLLFVGQEGGVHVLSTHTPDAEPKTQP